MIEANGVLFPDIPEEILAEYPFAVISQLTGTGTTGVRYMLGVSTSEYARIPKGIMPSPYGVYEWLGTATMSKAALNYSDTATVWGNWTEHPAGSGLYVYGEYEDEGITYVESLIWANHDVYNATSVDMSTGSYTLGDIYFPKSEEGKPSSTRYSIAKTILDAVARQIMRLSGSTAKVKPEEFETKLKAVESGGADIVELYEGTIKEVRHLTALMLKDGLFEECRSLTTASFPAVQQVSEKAFGMCIKLTSVYLPTAKYLFSYAFIGCSALKKLDLPAVTSIQTGAFANCTALEALILRSGTVCTLSTNAFTNSAIESGTGYIYVPSALVNSYKTATNWYAHAAQIRAIEDYPDICGTT